MIKKSEVTSSNKYLGTNDVRNGTVTEAQRKNALYIAQQLYKNGFSINAIAAMLGNMTSESTLNPGLYESCNSSSTQNGYGLVQWTPNTNFKNWAKSNGYEYGDIDGQLERIYWEIKHKKQWTPTPTYNFSFKDFKTSDLPVDKLASAFLKNYERAGVEVENTRRENAKYWFKVLQKSNIAFKPRTSAVTEDDAKKYYTKNTYKGGLNPCILGNNGSGGQSWKGSVLPNCVGYAWGRAYELMGKKPRLSTGDAGDWFKYNKDNKIYDYSTDKTKPKLGAIVCWSGHVAVVEEIKGTTITTSNYGWKYPSFYTSTFDTSKSMNYTNSSGSARNFQGYIYLPEIGGGDFSADEHPIIATSFIESVIEIAKKEVGTKAYNAKKCKYYQAIDKLHQQIDRNGQTLYWGFKNGVDWCAGFVDWCFLRAIGAIDSNNNPDPTIKSAKHESIKLFRGITNHSNGGASCGYAAGGYKDAGTYFARGEKTPQPGDEIFFNNFSHTGLVVDVKGSKVYTVEGNTGGGGGMVKSKSYSLTSTYITGYGRPNWELAPAIDPSSIPPAIMGISQKITEAKNPTDNDFVIEIDVNCGGIPKLTRGVTVEVDWHNPNEKYILTESIVKYINGDVRNTNVSISQNQFIDNSSNNDGRIVVRSDANTNLGNVNLYLRGSTKLKVRATQINIDPAKVKEYKDINDTNDIKDHLVTKNTDSKPNLVGEAQEVTIHLQSSIPVMNICLDNHFVQSIPYIYYKKKWCKVIPYIATSKCGGNIKWVDSINLRGILTDNYYRDGIELEDPDGPPKKQN